MQYAEYTAGISTYKGVMAINHNHLHSLDTSPARMHTD
jgi:hypothetical protein